MMLRVGNDTNPPFSEEWNPTDEEKVRSFNTLGGNAGYYEVEGSTLTIRPTVARGDVMGGHEVLQFEVSADTLRLTIVDVVSANGTHNGFYASGGRTHLRLVRLH